MDINQLAAAKIKKSRLDLGFTLESVAQELGIAKGNYSKLENGKVHITLEHIDQLARLFKVPHQQLSPFPANNVHINNGNYCHSEGEQTNNFSDPNIANAMLASIRIMQEALSNMERR